MIMIPLEEALLTERERAAADAKRVLEKIETCIMLVDEPLHASQEYRQGKPVASNQISLTFMWVNPNMKNDP
jgi:hypothetical protein